MEKFQHVLVRVWQSACRHIEISQSVPAIAAMLLDSFPLEQLLLREVDRQRSSLETIAVGLPDSQSPHPEARTECKQSEMRRLLAWVSRGKVAHRRDAAGDFRVPALAVPPGVEGDVLVGPLGDPRGVCGVLVLVASPGQTFEALHVSLAQALLEPFCTALANDHQLRELVRLRNAKEAENRSLLARLGRKELGDTIVGADAGLKTVMGRVRMVAPLDVPVLVFGETGTGKELVARAIHRLSRRSNGPMLRVNCGAIPPELIDSELFGHERGAFTGAVETREGWFERADGGTLFLDEIGELPPAAQVRLLRIVQDGWLQRVGAEQPVHVDVRIVAATHRDLAQMVAEGRFREDLWYRLSVFPIILPPLRERREDISALARHFAQRAAVRFNLPEVLPTPEDIALLSAYPWPGNVRELAAVIERAAILGDGHRLEIATALGAGNTLRQPAAGTPPPPAPDALPPSPGPENILPLDVVIRRHIEAALSTTNGRIEGLRGAAALLKINPHTLRAKMRKLGIDWRRFREKRPT